MDDLLLFLTSKEIMIVYIISAVACFICLTVYLVEKKNEKLRRKHNTKELNKLVELVKDKVEPQNIETYEQPVLEQATQPSLSVTDMITNIEAKEETSVEEVYVPTPTTEEQTVNIAEETAVKVDYQEIESSNNQEIKYTSIEPDEQTAKIELKKLEEELIKEEQEENKNIELTKFEEEQEKTAIISLDELLQKSRELYELNEITQYTDEGNEPISIQDLEKQMDKSVSNYDEPFIIANVVCDENNGETKVEVIDQNLKDQINKEYQEKPVNEKPILNVESIKVDESVIENAMNGRVIERLSTEKVEPVKEEKKEEKTFKRTPYISPIFGIERENNIDNDLALENTANYDKLDEEIKKTNNFVMTLKELQGKLD